MKPLKPGTSLLVAVAAAAILIGLTFAVDPFRSYQLATACAYLCAVAGLTLLTGAGGQLSLGQAALMAAGAYSYALSANALAEAEVEGPLLLLAPLGAAVLGAGVLGLIIGCAAGRLHGPYLAGFTLALVVAIPAVTSTFSNVLGGDQGLWITVEKRPAALRGTVSNEQWQAWLAIICAVAVMVVLNNLLRGRFGRQLRAVRDNDAAASLSGVNVARTKIISFTVSAAAAGLGGGLLAYVTQSASPGAYSLVLSLYLLMAAVIGGIGSLTGAVWGALVMVFLPYAVNSFTADLPVSADVASRLDGNLAIAVFGTILVLVILLAPRGIQGLLSAAGRRIRARVSPGPGPSNPAPAVVVPVQQSRTPADNPPSGTDKPPSGTDNPPSETLSTTKGQR
ncbi:branched-chain amino acid ABC transporter permease [Arthrobacter sunyaminii]|uniref:Branched-chain amino acid ABC transporter permease n=1 Tax=Arthrobacter sunyaminii TaxID=2816859 RepID=A0A975S469_9MICC|nr:branched-chain amino acid ABC transporter permease [Arthrobacter sunyaminii]MBO0909132.1 branched-chain amino acid ABC transporter permease [Arthrobacter sunyaminii]QWQ35380.1 branched-chain amino acid ABC transporter permease [Arthrobacter sunyaminii]